jgi:beta-glucosidase
MMSDWYGTKSTTAALDAGLDLEMPGPSVFRGSKLVDAVNRGEISDESLDAAVKNILQMIDLTAASHGDKGEKSLVCDRTSAMALRTASEGIVLLKNDHNILPLEMKGNLKVAIIGAAALKPSITGGGSACAKPQYLHTPLQCFRDACEDPEQISFARGIKTHYLVPLMPVDIMQARDGLPGVNVDYYLDGTDTPIFSEHSEQPVVVMLGKVKPGLSQSRFYFVIETTVTVTTRGNHKLAVQATGEFALFVDGVEVNTMFTFIGHLLDRMTDKTPLRYFRSPPRS